MYFTESETRYLFNLIQPDINEINRIIANNENTGEEEFNCSIGDCSYIQNYIDINGY